MSGQFHTWTDYLIKLHCLDVKPVISGISSHSTDLVNSCCIQYANCVNLSFEIMFVLAYTMLMWFCIYRLHATVLSFLNVYLNKNSKCFL